MFSRLWLVILLLHMFACAAPAFGSQSLPPVVIARKLSAAETAAGSVAGAVRGRPADISWFGNLGGVGRPTQQTVVRLAYDNANL